MRRKKTTVIIVMCVAMLFMAVGYALLSTRLDIGGSTAVTSSWKVEFTAIRVANYKGGATGNNPQITNTSASFNVNLVQPGDEITYEIDITNFGDIIAEIKGATYSIEGSEAIYVDIDGVRKGTRIGSCEGLTTCPKVTMIIRIGYDPAVEKDPTLKSKTIDITLDVGQYVSNNPTPDAELVPELVEQNDTLAQHILRDNNPLSDGAIDFSKPSYYYTYSQQYNSSTGTKTGLNSSNTYYFGTSFDYNPATGQYSLFGTIKGQTLANWRSTGLTITDSNGTSNSYYYTCASTFSSATCTYLYYVTSIPPNTTSISYVATYLSMAEPNTNGQGLYYTSVGTEGNKPTYYFRGNVTNNYVKFGKNSSGNDLYWRIIRINEDGSVRLIYQGTSATATGSNTEIGENYFNYYGEYNAEVGYMYGTPGSSTYANEHKNTNSSDIKAELDNWYVENLKTNYSKYIADAGFCNDRSVAPTVDTWEIWDTTLGYGTNVTYYGAFNRLRNKHKPQFACPQTKDLFTTSTSSKGNKALTNPIGLITADEVVYAGAGDLLTHNQNNYLHTGNSYWTMTPGWYNGYANVFAVWDVGNAYPDYCDVPYGIRPVINLKSDVIATLNGSGTPGSSSNPYVVVTN